MSANILEDAGDGVVDDDAEMPLPTLTLPLDGWHRARGARMVAFAGYEMPVQYDGIIAEHLWTRASAGLFDVSHMGQLVVSAPDAPPGELDAAIEAILPIDMATLKPGMVRYSLLLDANGGILDDLMVTRRGGDVYVVVNGATKWDDIAYLRELLPDAITLTHLDEHALLAVQGPLAAQALARIGIVPARDGGVAPDALTFMRGGGYRWDGRPLGISRSGYTGEDGFEISVREDDAVALADALCGQGEIKPIGLGARDSLRLEAGLPLYGHDLGPETDPFTADLGFAINRRRRADGGFVGARRVLQALAQPTPRMRVGLALEGRMAAREGALVLAGDAHVGLVTSGGFSPTLQRPIAMAYVARDHAAPGTPLTIEARGRRIAATVAPLPFVPHRYFR